MLESTTFIEMLFLKGLFFAAVAVGSEPAESLKSIPCVPTSEVISPAEYSDISIWAVLKKAERHPSKPEEELEFVERKRGKDHIPKTVKLLVKDGPCKTSRQVGLHYRVEIKKNRPAYFYRISTVDSKKLNPGDFEPELKMCDGFDEKSARANADLMILGKMVRNRNLKSSGRIETDFKVLKTLKGDAKIGSVTVVAIDQHACTVTLTIGSKYIIALKQIEGGKYYYDCCDLAGAESY